MIKKLILILTALANGLTLIGGAGETATPDQLSQAIGGYTQTLTAQLTDLTVQRAGLAKNVVELRAAMVALEGKHAGLTEAIGKATREKEAAAAALQDSRAQRGDTGKRKEALAASTAGLGTAVSDLSGQLSEKNAAIEQIKREIEDLLTKQKALLEQMKGEHDAAHKDLLARRQAELDRLGRQLADFEKELADLQSQRTGASTILAQKKAELEKKRAELVALGEKHSTLTAQVTETDAALAKHTQNLAALQTKKIESDRQLTELQAQFKIAQDRFAAYQKTIGEGIGKLVAQVTVATNELKSSTTERSTTERSTIERSARA